MKYLILLGLITLGLPACSEIAPPPSVQAAFQAAEDGMFVGIDKYTEASLEVPSRHMGPYAQVKQLNFIIESGIYKDMEANLVIVQYDKNDEWEVIRLMVNNHGDWQLVPRTDNKVE